MVHWKTFAPIPSPTIVEFGDDGETIVPVPETSVHAPFPTEGKFPFSEVVEVHIVWSAPAFEAEGFESTLMIMVSVDGGQVP